MKSRKTIERERSERVRRGAATVPSLWWLSSLMWSLPALQLDEFNAKKLYRHPDDYDWDGDLHAPGCETVLIQVGVDISFNLNVKYFYHIYNLVYISL